MTRFVRSALALALGTTLLAGCVCTPHKQEDPALAACQDNASKLGIATHGSHFGSLEGKSAEASLPRRALEGIGRVMDAPAPNPLFGVAVTRCLRASARG